MDKTVTEWQIMFTMTSGLEDFYTEDEDEYNEKFQDLIDDGDLQYVEQCIRKDYVWNEELEDWDEDYVEVLYDAENYDDYKDTQRGSVANEYKYKVSSYYDMKYLGLEDTFYTNEWSEVEDEAHKKLMQGNCVLIQNLITGKEIKLNPDEYDETFDGEFLVKPDQLEESKQDGKLVKTFKETDYGWGNNETTYYGELNDGNYYVCLGETDWTSMTIYDAPITKKYLDYLYREDDEDTELEKYFNQFEKEHNVTSKYSLDSKEQIEQELNVDYLGYEDLDESKDTTNSEVNKKDEKYNVYTLNGEDGVYNSNKVDTVDTIEQAEDRVRELQAETGNNAYYEEADEWWEQNYKRAINYVANETPEVVVGLFGYDNKEDNAAWDMYMSSTSKSIALELLHYLGQEEFEKVLDEYERNLNESYVSYEEPYNGKKMSKAQWKEIYDKEINHNPNNDGWETFEDWWYDMTEKDKLIVKENVEGKKVETKKTEALGKLSDIQGLEYYSESEIKQMAIEYIREALLYADEDPDDLEIVDMNIYGSRKRGTAKEDSDLDIVFEYKGDFREDDLFNLLNDEEEPLMFDDVVVDFNPICAERSGDMSSFMARAKAYDDEILNKKKTESVDTNNLFEQANKLYNENAISAWQLFVIGQIVDYIDYDLEGNSNISIDDLVRLSEEFDIENTNVLGQLSQFIRDNLGSTTGKLNEDQYENYRRKGKPNVSNIAETEYEDNIEWYKEHIKDFVDEKDFIAKNITDIAAEYNLKANSAQDVCAIIYKLATSKKVESKYADDYRGNEYWEINDLYNEEGSITEEDVLEELKKIYASKQAIKKAYEEITGQKLDDLDESKSTDDIEELKKEIVEIDEKIKSLEHLQAAYTGEKETYVYELQNEIEELEDEKQQCEAEIKSLSREKKTESKSANRQLKANYKKSVERELEKVQNNITNARSEDKAELESRKDFLVSKIDQLDESKDNDKVEVEHYHLEDMGGHTMAVFGSLKDGRYFAGNEEVMTIYDEDIWPQYCEDDPDTTAWEKEHTLLSTSRYDTNKENLQLYYDIISQTSFFDEDDLVWFKEHLGLDNNDVADKKNESKLVEKTNIELQEEIEEKINNAIYQYLIKDGYETEESAKEFIKDYVVVKTWYEDMTSASSAEILEKYLVVEVRAELDYDDLSTMSNYLDKVVQKYDASSYFDFITGGTIRAYIQVDTRKPKDTKSSKKKTESKEVNRANALLDLINEVYDGMGDMYAEDEWAEILASDYDLDSENMEADKIILTALNKMDDNAFKNEVDNFIVGLVENDGVDYLKDTLHVYPRNLKHIIQCLNTIKPYASEPDKIDTAIEELKGVNMDLRTIAEEFQRYLHDNYKPWTVLGSTSGPRTYVNLFEVPTEYDIVGADYFNYANRPNDMLENIGYGWKQDGDKIVADLIGYTHSVKVGDKYAAAVYDQAPVKYGYSAVIDSSNKEAKFKEMANALMSKAKEIKEKYKLGESKVTEARKNPEINNEVAPRDERPSFKKGSPYYSSPDEIDYKIDPERVHNTEPKKYRVRSKEQAQNRENVGSLNFAGMDDMMSFETTGFYDENDMNKNSREYKDLKRHIKANQEILDKHNANPEESPKLDVDYVKKSIANDKRQATRIYNKVMNKKTEAVNIEDVNIEKEKEKVADDIQTAGVKDMIDTEKELEDGIKKEIYQFAKQQGLDLEKLRKQGVELETIADTIDTVIGDMVSKSAIEYMDQTNQEINWDFEIVGNDIKIVWEKK